jgi:hypothetical protein
MLTEDRRASHVDVSFVGLVDRASSGGTLVLLGKLTEGMIFFNFTFNL